MDDFRKLDEKAQQEERRRAVRKKDKAKDKGEDHPSYIRWHDYIVDIDVDGISTRESPLFR